MKTCCSPGYASNGTGRSVMLKSRHRLKREPVMTRCTCELIASASNGHFCRLQRGVVGGGEPTTVRQLLDRRILKIASDERPPLDSPQLGEELLHTHRANNQ